MKIHDKMEQMLGTWVDDDYCGTPYPHHIGPGGPPFRISVKADVLKSLPQAQREKAEGLMKEYPAMAKAAYGELSKVAGLLKNVATLVSQTKAK